jgi:hypothetical protein
MICFLSVFAKNRLKFIGFNTFLAGFGKVLCESCIRFFAYKTAGNNAILNPFVILRNEGSIGE